MPREEGTTKRDRHLLRPASSFAQKKVGRDGTAVNGVLWRERQLLRGTLKCQRSSAAPAFTLLRRSGMAHAGPKTATEVGEDTGLPKALVKKIVKNKIHQTLAYSVAPDAQEPKKDIQINKDALLAFSESAKVVNNGINELSIGSCRCA